MDTRATTSAITAATGTDTRHTSVTMAVSVWYILIDHNNKLFGEPNKVNLAYNADTLRLKEEIKEGPYKKGLTRVNITDMEVWRFEAFTLRGTNPKEIGGLVERLFTSGGGQEVGVWEPVIELRLGEYEPMIVRV